jgi:hypothetical protein
MINPRWLVGKTIARVEMNPFEAHDPNQIRCGSGRRVAHDPRIYFTDGTSISFVTEETEIGEYGTDIVYRKKGRS